MALVGSAISLLIEANASSEGLVAAVGEFAGALKSAMRAAPDNSGDAATR